MGNKKQADHIIELSLPHTSDKIYSVLLSNALEVLDYEIQHGDGSCKDLEKKIEKKYNFNTQKHLNPGKIEKIGKRLKKMAQKFGVYQRLYDRIQTFENEYGPTLLGDGYGINQEDTIRKYLGKEI